MRYFTIRFCPKFIDYRSMLYQLSYTVRMDRRPVTRSIYSNWKVAGSKPSCDRQSFLPARCLEIMIYLTREHFFLIYICECGLVHRSPNAKECSMSYRYREDIVVFTSKGYHNSPCSCLHDYVYA